MVERAIGHMKGRFRRLREIYSPDLSHICNFIMAGCVMHNLCILHEDDVESFIDINQVDAGNNYVNIYPNAQNGVVRRDTLVAQF